MVFFFFPSFLSIVPKKPNIHSAVVKRGGGGPTTWEEAARWQLFCCWKWKGSWGCPLLPAVSAPTPPGIVGARLHFFFFLGLFFGAGTAAFYYSCILCIPFDTGRELPLGVGGLSFSGDSGSYVDTNTAFHQGRGLFSLIVSCISILKWS